MKRRKTSPPGLVHARTGIIGFDEITRGGLPQGRTTLIGGGPGCGKTIIALQTLVNGARLDGEPGIFVAFEESSERIMANAASFGWDLDRLQKDKLFFMNAQPDMDVVQAGSFDLSGMLAALDVKVRAMKARRIVFDAIDIVLALLDDPAAERREIYRLHEWLLARGLTAIITAKKLDRGKYWETANSRLNILQFMVDCSVLLLNEVVDGVSQRNLRVLKFRGSSFSANESPFLIDGGGMEVAGTRGMEVLVQRLTDERISSGVPRLDAMLGGGYHRGASVLITGFPGTAKSTLSGAFAEAACERGERVLFISFDSDANEVIRNLTSVNIRLERFVKKGLLDMVSARTISDSAEIHFMHIKQRAREHAARCVVIDPVSALSKGGSLNTVHNVAERLIDWTKREGVTLLCTSLLEMPGQQSEGTPLQVSTLADTWIHLNYLVQAGERNRGLSIVKSRGTAHSNQVRELVLSDSGITLADAYTAGGEVLMGTMRWEKEQAERTQRIARESSASQKKAVLEAEESELEGRLKTLQRELDAKRAEKQLLAKEGTTDAADIIRRRTELRELRKADLL